MSTNVVLQANFLKRLKEDRATFEKNTDVSPHYAISLAAELEDEFTQARDRHNKILITKTSEPITEYLEGDVFGNIRRTYHNLWALVNDAIPQGTSSLSTHQGGMNTSTSAPGTTHEMKLPKIDIPHFSGDYNEWMNFHNLFTLIVHSSPNLEPIHKLQYLRNCLTGEALKVIKNLELNGDNYYEARKLLKARFQHTRQLVDSYFKRIFKAPAIPHETSKAIKGLIDNIQDCKTSLKKLDVVIPDYVVIYHMVEILPSETVREWGESLGGSTELPLLNKFLEFLEKRFRIAEMTEGLNKVAKKTQKAFHVQTKNVDKQEKGAKGRKSKPFKNEKKGDECQKER